MILQASNFKRSLISAALLLPLASMAEETPDEGIPTWKGKAELGIVNTSGNSNTSSTNGKINLIYEAEKWRQEFRLETHQAESEIVDDNNQEVTQKTADRTYFYSKSDYKYSEKSYAYALLDYADETFTSKDYIGNFSIGYGRTFIKQKDQQLEAEVGYGLRRFQNRNEVIAEEEEVARLAGKYSVKISDNASFSQELITEFGKAFDVYKSNTALTVNINSSMALSVGYEVQHTSDLTAEDIAAGTEKTDTITTVNLVYNFL